MPSSPVRILGLDPGSRHTGFGVIEQSRGRLTVVRFGRFSTPPRVELARRLAQLVTELDELVRELEPSRAALETPFQGLNPRSLIVLAQARGALLATLAGRNVAVREYTPTQVKGAVSGYGRASKEQVARMVEQILSLDERIANEDASDALAVAICCANRSRMDELTASRSA